MKKYGKVLVYDGYVGNIIDNKGRGRHHYKIDKLQ